MADLGTTTTAGRDAVAPDRARPDRTVRPRRGLPGGRAVIGGFLVAAAAVGTFAAYTNATADPDTAYVVAARDLSVGTRLSAADLTTVAIDLPEDQAARAVPEDRAEELVDLLTLGPLAAGDLVHRTDVVRLGAAADEETVSFAVPRSRALMGAIRPGETVDVAATYQGNAAGSFSIYVVRGARVVAVDEGAGTFGEDGLVFTLAVEGPEQVLAIINAVDAAEVFVTRPARGDDPVTPPPFRPEGE